MDRAQLTDWVERYERAWRASGTELLAELFSREGTYSTAPYEEPHRGLDAIRRMWEAERSRGEEFTLESEILAVEGDTGVVRVTVEYRMPRRKQYRDLWIVTLDTDGRCTAFEEWPFWPPGSGGAPASGAGG